MKRYALASAAAINSTAAGTDTWYLAVAGAAVLAVFWLMDAQYLSQERQYRALFNKVRQPEAPADFDLKISQEIIAKHPLRYTVSGWSVMWLYLSLIVLSLIIAGVIDAPQQTEV